MNNENNPHDEKIFRNRKPGTCPSCNGKNVAVILWGLPANDPKFTKQHKKIKWSLEDVVFQKMILHGNALIVM